MSKKSKKKPSVNKAAKKQNVSTAKKKASRSAKKKAPQSKLVAKLASLNSGSIALIVTCALVLIIALTVGIIYAVDYVKNDKGFDYLDSDMSKYVSISQGDYKDYYLEVDVAKPRDVDLESAILAIIATKKGDRLCGENDWLTSGANLKVTPGSTVKLWYRGYRVGENGEKLDVEGLSNFAATSASQISIGSLIYPPGFEVGLVGAPLSADRVLFSKITQGEVKDDYVIYLNYTRTATSSSAKSQATNLRVDLSTDVDADFGQGFKSHLLGMTIGESKKFSITGADGTHYEYDANISFATDCENQEGILQIEAYFPYGYTTEALRNEDIVFDIYIESIQPYEYDDFTDEFVEELVKGEDSNITAEELEKYDGNGAAEKYRAYLWESLEETYQDSYNDLTEEAMWDHLIKTAKIKKYPASQLRLIYENYINGIQDQYSASGGQLWNSSTYQYDSYDTLDSFADAYLGFNSTADYGWCDYVMDVAKRVVAQRMILYYIMDAEGITPTKQQYDEKRAELQKEYFETYLEIYFEQNEIDKDELTDEEYKTYENKCRRDFNNLYDEEFFEETTYYNLVLDTLMSWADVSTLDERSAYPQDK